MSSDANFDLGEFLTASEAERLSVQLEAGQHIIQALDEIGNSRRSKAHALLTAANISHHDPQHAVAVLNAIQGAKSIARQLTPVWTMPGHEANTGHLTSEFYRYVESARISVTCATYNFEPTSTMWTSLRSVSDEPGVVVTVYVDGGKADAAKVQAQLPKATIYRSTALPGGQQVVSHAKFIVIDHEILLLTSANFSYSAESRNIEFGLLVHDQGLAASIERIMVSKHGSLYELAQLPT